MRKFLGCFTLLLAAVSTGYAVPVLAPPSPACSSFGSGPANDISIAFAVWSAAGFNCESGDKIFSNFAFSGALPTDTTLELQTQTLGPIDLHGVTWNSNFIGSFSASYDIAVDLVMSPNMRIVRVSGDLSNPSNLGTPTNVKQLFLESGAPDGTLTSTAGSPGTPLVVDTTALHVVDTYTPLGGAAVSISNTFAEAAVPEPVSLFLMGSGLLVLAKLKRARV
jgi:hypothetical protein